MSKSIFKYIYLSSLDFLKNTLKFRVFVLRPRNGVVRNVYLHGGRICTLHKVSKCVCALKCNYSKLFRRVYHDYNYKNTVLNSLIFLHPTEYTEQPK